ncbi:SWIM zinc finger family protein [Desulfobotulus mexicanus]|uniref:SWIM-type domain-containing protein n=1 Tax=Desulfobotulus mexicanus TaxID=2586642 RepID=A0A5Q4VA80_9BACT|nr:SWIM zinc finger family protein [Desulfobotulus mexicanus]TYT74654.1 hypothetical protein FIM25_08625 [Desulfobotulus mexicanus]
MSRYWNSGFSATRPREVKDGIRAGSQKGAMASKWWGRRWIAVLEAIGGSTRMARGRSYARKGQVSSLEILPGEIRARVQGSARTPYMVSIKLRTLQKTEWKKVAHALMEAPLVAARLIAGEMPEEMEAIAQRVSVPFFPEKNKDLETNCSCPDWSDPCKHIAAVYYLVAEALDQNPFLLFQLRGMEREAFVGLLGLSPERGEAPESEKAEAQPLKSEAPIFWGEDRQYTGLVPVADASMPEAFIRRLGRPPFWRSSRAFFPLMQSVYGKAAAAGLDLCAGGMGEDGER